MPQNIIQTILDVTACHPYYVNRLCRQLWDSKHIPTEALVIDAWQEYVTVQRDDWMAEVVGRLSLNQRELMLALANEPVQQITGKEFVHKLNLSLSSIQRALESLLKIDYIHQTKDGYYDVLNPAMKTYLQSICGI